MLRNYSEKHTDGSNQFIYSRFLVPYMEGFKGWAIFADGDMVLKDDVAKLWAMRDDRFAAMVVKHNYSTKHKRKYIGSAMETINTTYPRKNWSSVILWNCNHPSNAVLTPRYVEESTGSQLHRFSHLSDDEIGELPAEWNWLAEEYPANDEAKLVHYTLGVPAIPHYKDCAHADDWLDAHRAANYVLL